VQNVQQPRPFYSKFGTIIQDRCRKPNNRKNFCRRGWGGKPRLASFRMDQKSRSALRQDSISTSSSTGIPKNVTSPLLECDRAESRRPQIGKFVAHFVADRTDPVIFVGNFRRKLACFGRSSGIRCRSCAILTLMASSDPCTAVVLL